MKSLTKKTYSARKAGFDGSALKWIAIVTMVIDHIGASVLLNVLGQLGSDRLFWGLDRQKLYIVYELLRYIGRVSFPIFCFLLVEGFFHTRDRRKYAVRLLIFAFVSEIPFDLAFELKWWDPSHQNVMFTLFIGLVTIALMDRFRGNFPRQALIAAAGAFLAWFLKTDYDWLGVVTITVLYLFHDNPSGRCISGALSVAWELPAPLAFIPVYFYNGERGRGLKYFFYVFYPAHLLVFYFITKSALARL